MNQAVPAGRNLMIGGNKRRSTGYIGVSEKPRKSGKFAAEIKLKLLNDKILLGSHSDSWRAARAYDFGAYFLDGENAELNFPNDPPPILHHYLGQDVLNANKMQLGKEEKNAICMAARRYAEITAPKQGATELIDSHAVNIPVANQGAPVGECVLNASLSFGQGLQHDTNYPQEPFSQMEPESIQSLDQGYFNPETHTDEGESGQQIAGALPTEVGSVYAGQKFHTFDTSFPTRQTYTACNPPLPGGSHVGQAQFGNVDSGQRHHFVAHGATGQGYSTIQLPFSGFPYAAQAQFTRGIGKPPSPTASRTRLPGPVSSNQQMHFQVQTIPPTGEADIFPSFYTSNSQIMYRRQTPLFTDSLGNFVIPQFHFPNPPSTHQQIPGQFQSIPVISTPAISPPSYTDSRQANFHTNVMGNVNIPQYNYASPTSFNPQIPGQFQTTSITGQAKMSWAYPDNLQTQQRPNQFRITATTGQAAMACSYPDNLQNPFCQYNNAYSHYSQMSEIPAHSISNPLNLVTFETPARQSHTAYDDWFSRPDESLSVEQPTQPQNFGNPIGLPTWSDACSLQFGNPLNVEQPTHAHTSDIFRTDSQDQSMKMNIDRRQQSSAQLDPLVLDTFTEDLMDSQEHQETNTKNLLEVENEDHYRYLQGSVFAASQDGDDITQNVHSPPVIGVGNRSPDTFLRSTYPSNVSAEAQMNDSQMPEGILQGHVQSDDNATGIQICPSRVPANHGPFSQTSKPMLNVLVENYQSSGQPFVARLDDDIHDAAVTYEKGESSVQCYTQADYYRGMVRNLIELVDEGEEGSRTRRKMVEELAADQQLMIEDSYAFYYQEPTNGDIDEGRNMNDDVLFPDVLGIDTAPP